MIAVIERFMQGKGLCAVETIGVWEVAPQTPHDNEGSRRGVMG